MNIDIATLLLGGSEKLPNVGKLSAENFGLQLDEKLADLDAMRVALNGDLLPDLAAQVEPVNSVLAEQLPGDEALSDEESTALFDTLHADNPQWQLQQLVVRNTSSSATAPRTASAAGAQPVDVMGAVSSKRPAAPKPVAPLTFATVAETTAANSAPPISAVQPLLTEGALPVEPAQPNPQPVTLLTGGLRPVAMPAAHATATVSYPPEAPEWKQSVSQHIALFSRNGLHNAEIRLHPEELGALHITLRMHQEQAQIHIVSEHALVRQAMESALPQLRQALAESGVQLGQASVGAENPHAGAEGERASDAQAAAAQAEENGVEEEVVPTLLTSSPGNIYGINTFA